MFQVLSSHPWSMVTILIGQHMVTMLIGQGDICKFEASFNFLLLLLWAVQRSREPGSALGLIEALASSDFQRTMYCDTVEAT